MKRAVHECTGCHGERVSLSEEWEGDGMRVIAVTCEGCEGCGEVTSCEVCDEVMSLLQADRNGGVCDVCVDDGNRSDAAAEMAWLSRRSA